MTSSAEQIQSTNQKVRRKIIDQRSALSRSQRQRLNQDLSHFTFHCSELRNSHRIASYLAFMGEADTTAIHQQFENKHFHIPKITDYYRSQMRFTPLSCNSMIHNQFGINENASMKKALFAQQFNVVLLPLVAFNRQGGRLGMGGGYYDRALAFRKYRQYWHSPKLIGLAYDFQESNDFIQQDWDVPLDVIITNQEIIYRNNHEPET